jgi:hypothetical protein
MKGICMEINLYDVYGSAVAYIDKDYKIWFFSILVANYKPIFGD